VVAVGGGAEINIVWEQGNIMRKIFIAAIVLSSCLAASAQAPAPAPAPPAQQFDVPTTGKPQTVMILTRDFTPGQSAGRHIHHGVEMTLVIRGALEMLVDGQAPHTYQAGESFIVPREVPHDARNPGTVPTTIAVTYVIDKGTPPRIAVP
jgi:quercetin dioxygenase-like cupin family protein